MKSLLLATTALLLGIGTASAQDRTYDWSGAYVGAQMGYGWSKPATNVVVLPSPLFTLDIQHNANGALGGLYAGYNFQMRNNVVLGLEADINAANLDDKTGDSTLTSGGVTVPYPYLPTSFKMSWNGAVRGRVGYAVGRFLPYVAGGVSFGEYKLRFYDKTITTHSSTRIGWNIGAGLDYAVTDKITLRAEYRFADFGSEKFPFSTYSFPSKNDLKTHEVLFGVAYKF
jgi:outer membrane immunogenic protein